jgi:hypothetical protein
VLQYEDLTSQFGKGKGKGKSVPCALTEHRAMKAY